MADESQVPKGPANPTPTPPPPAGPQTTPQGAAIDQREKDSRLWATLCHLSALAGFVTLGGSWFFAPLVGLGFFLGPLVVWLLKRHDVPFVDEQGKEAVNFQLTMFITFVIAAVLLIALIGFVLLPALAILDVVLLIIAAVKANDGEHYRYPFAIRFIK